MITFGKSFLTVCAKDNRFLEDVRDIIVGFDGQESLYYKQIQMDKLIFPD